ncbi:DUF3889 domain-containing protein [Halobacillus amylolyticus]|uniref:DUF3889 domain-containing protein n=1 Tax=Halobacillus amylolyticus TaxID=2932259 RepID=A0ABY4HE59_9BACI|nr:DUF3889 domain-containing protein [Halobacillus amylolyticus]UOR12573.1 DUF3889 domain-containing protein [Halobacillus amylolyticus]
MYSNYSYIPYVNQQGPYVQHPYYNYSRSYIPHPYYPNRQQAVRGQATWTEGGQVTQCGIPWSENQYMTVAIGENTPYQCGQTLKVTNLSNQREVLVTVVDKVPGYPPNKVNLHRKAFETLRANLGQGVINVEITPSPELEQEKWGKYLLELTQTAYPGYNVTEYNTIGKTQVSPTQTKETYEYILQSPQERIKVQGNVVYNSTTDRVISFDIKEV